MRVAYIIRTASTATTTDQSTGSSSPGASLITYVDQRFGNEDIFAIALEPVTPGARITDISARPKRGKISLLWSDVPRTHHYDIYRSTGGEPYELIQEGHQTDYYTLLDTQRANGKQYC